MTKWVYNFGGGKADGRSDMRDLLGGKGANLAEMSTLGLPVPPGFTISTAVCTHYYDNGRRYPDDLNAAVEDAIGGVEKRLGMGFGDSTNPLLVSVRSGSRASMPGMMDTVLNLGLNDETAEGLAKKTGDRRFALDSYRRFIQMYSDVVLGVDHFLFDDVLDSVKRANAYTLDTDLSAADWEDVIEGYKRVVADETPSGFPQDAREQLWGAVGAVFGSWQNQRAITYRRLHNIPDAWGTAVTVQAMVFGNMGNDCATGVAFTRDPSTGENVFYGEYLINAQGEDVVAGIRTPQALTKASRENAGSKMPSMEEEMPGVFGQLVDIRTRLESHYKDMQDIEFTIQQGELFILQTRNGKRTAPAALKIAVDLCHDGVIDETEAVSRVEPASLDQLLHPRLDPDAERNVIAKGLPASPGAAAGIIVLNADDAEARAGRGEIVILVREETSPEDIHGMHAAAGIVTTRGGMTSHAAVVARGMGRPCVSGVGGMRIDEKSGQVMVAGHTLKTGDRLTIDGGTGEVMLGDVETIQPTLSGDFGTLMGWADKHRRMRVRANAETPADARTAVSFGAEGIGLCRTEHMFFDQERITEVRRMILSTTEKARRAALDRLLPMQRSDFVALFTIMRGLPVTVRLLDPPLHEFLPRSDGDFADVAQAAGVDVPTVRHRALQLHESNPMLGHRGCRLGITYPEIYEMQVRAILEAAVEVARESGDTVIPEIMIPLAFSREELDILKSMIDRVADEVGAGTSLTYLVGTMIELPRAALCANKLAETAEFFSFGTNDLTQTTLGISRDDSSNFMGPYVDQGILDRDPFATLDQEGVGQLVRMGVERGRETRPDIKLGICGEHGGDPDSIGFCEAVGLDYVSCSPFRVPIARLAAAQASLKSQRPGD